VKPIELVLHRRVSSKYPRSAALAIGIGLLAAACFDGPFRQPFREQRLPSGGVIKITSCLLAWGDDHGPAGDAFELEYVSAIPSSQTEHREREAREAFELIRPVAEQLGLADASVAAFTTLERTGRYDLFIFTRSTTTTWSIRHEERKVHINDP
jgi:hypothetical protein